MKNFRTYDLAKDLYSHVTRCDWPTHLRDQALRASSSIVLNLAEGAGLPSKKQKSKHYAIAMGSLREVQAALEINPSKDTGTALQLADQVAAQLYRLCQATN